MDYTKLEELMKINKKGDASQTNKKLFAEEMSQMLNEEGLTEQAIKYLKSGFGFVGAKPLAVFIQKSPQEKRGEIISKILTSELFRGGDKVAAFKLAVNLSAYSIMWLGEDQRLLAEMIRLQPGLSKNKEKQMLKDASKIYEKYFLSLVGADTEYPSLDPETTGLSDFSLREYRKLLESILNNVSEEYSAKVGKIYAWIGFAKEIKPAEKMNEEGEKLSEESSVKEEKKKESEPYSEKELASMLVGARVFSERMKATVEQWAKVDRARLQNQEYISELKKTAQDLQMQLDALQKKNDGLTTELEQSRLLVVGLREQIKVLEGSVSERDGQISNLQEEIQRLNSIITVYSADKQNSQSEQLNAIASKLKSEYRDFMDAANEEMTVALGENFRFQLQSIFKILVKAGIDVERR